MLNGEPIGAMRRVPAGDDHRSNVHAGGRCVNHDLSEKELDLCAKLGPKLVEDGLFLVGIDLMGGKLIEVNVCSPGGFAEINEGGNKNDNKIFFNPYNCFIFGYSRIFCWRLV